MESTLAYWVPLSLICAYNISFFFFSFPGKKREKRRFSFIKMNFNLLVYADYLAYVSPQADTVSNFLVLELFLFF